MEIQAGQSTAGGGEAAAPWKPKGQPGSKKCILSFDGGGVRGLMCCVMIEYLESKLQVSSHGGFFAFFRLWFSS
jgi:hypothetical protein